MRLRNSSQLVGVRSVTSAPCWGTVSCLVGALAFSCSRDETRVAVEQERAADQMLEQLQRVSPFQRAAGAESGVVEQAPPVSRAEARAAELPFVDAGASPEVTSPEITAPDAGAAEPVPSGGAPDAGAGTVEPPRDIVADAALPLHGLVGGELLSEAQLWQRLQQAPVTCFGELHNRAGDHFAQTRALAEELARASGAPLALGMEMFQRPFQEPLSAYVSGQLDEAGLIAATEYETRWGYDFAFYRPLLEAARSAGLPALALNAPRELTRTIGRTGLESLSESERAQLPELDLDDAEHREFIFGLLGALDHDVQLALENVYVAQTVWDETMAETSATWLASAGPDARLLILAGSAHCHESAIPRRLARRLASAQPSAPSSAESEVEVTSLAVALASELSAPGFSAAGYDVLVVMEDVPLPADLPRAE